MLPIALLALALSTTTTAYPAALPPALLTLLQTGKWDKTPPSFRVVALSNLADLCARAAPSNESAACLLRVRELALQTKPPRLDLRAPSTEHGLWLSHFNLILGRVQEQVKEQDPTLHHRISAALATRALAEKTGIGPSYPGARMRWPADQLATLASLARHDRLHGTKLLDEPLRRFRAGVPIDQALGLPVSEVLGTTKTSRYPRGCALSWSVRYLAEFDLPAATELWKTYRNHYLISAFLIVGLREWPPGVDRGADVDSGPVIHGIGAAATAFGLIAARAVDDESTAARLEGAARVAEALGLAPAAAQTVLAVSIRALGKSPAATDATPLAR